MDTFQRRREVRHPAVSLIVEHVNRCANSTSLHCPFNQNPRRYMCDHLDLEKCQQNVGGILGSAINIPLPTW